ncbi:MAG TPA: VOC family protein [Acidimicrobiales bacterium]
MSDTTLTPNPTGAPVTWFEIGTDDPEAARAFYGALLGWRFTPEGPYTLISTVHGEAPSGGIQDTAATQRTGAPRTYAIPYAEVADVAATCARVEDLGGKVLVPATTTPAGIVLAHIADPAGNHIALWTPPPDPAG